MEALLGLPSGFLLLEHERRQQRFVNLSHSQGVRGLEVRVLENSRNFTRSHHLRCCARKQQDATQRCFCSNSRSSDGVLHVNNVGTRSGEDDDGGDVRYYIRRIREALGAGACVDGHGCFSVSGEANIFQPHTALPRDVRMYV